MSIGPTGMAGSAAGAPLAQNQGSDVQKTQQDTADQTRQNRLQEKAQQAEGVGETEQDEHASDRDADGRRLWEKTAPAEDGEPAADADDTPGERTPSKDPTGERGQHLDLSG